MELKLIKSLWGMTGSLEENLARIAAAGYQGIESPLPLPGVENQFKELLEKHKLDYVAQVLTNGDHEQSFADQAYRAQAFHPLFIVSHSARDCMSYEEQLCFFEKALRIEKEIGIVVAHETHRKRAMFTPWTTARLLRDLEALKITADFSHWCCVCESLLEDQEENLAIAMERTIHIHGRVGYAEGPQVTDPRAPEFGRELDTHIGWWNQICKEHAMNGAEFITFTPEFGPPGYMHTLPYTRQPVVDLWEICQWMANYFESQLQI